MDMENSNYRPVTLGDWILTYLLISIPLVNIILLFVWAFGANTPISKANWAKALLIWMLIGIVLYILFFFVLGMGAVAAGMAAQ